MQLGEPVLLTDITVSHNPRASLRGVLDRFHLEGRAEHPESTRKVFVSYMTENHPEIETLRKSIETHGLLQPPVVRAFRAKDGEQYVQRYGIVLGESRILAYALTEAQTGVSQKVKVRIESKLGVDAAFEQGLAENLDRSDMNPVDMATAFHEMLTIRINPKTKLPEVDGQPNPLYSADRPKGRPYTLKELAERVGKTYWWVRDHEAIAYLPEKLKIQCIKSWQSGKRNVTRFCKLGLRYKAQSTGQPEEETGVDNSAPVLENTLQPVGTTVENTTTENVVAVPPTQPVVTEDQNLGDIELSLEPAKRRRVLTLKAVVGLFDATPLENQERLAAFAEVMGISLETALDERKLRSGNNQEVLQEAA